MSSSSSTSIKRDLFLYGESSGANKNLNNKNSNEFIHEPSSSSSVSSLLPAPVTPPTKSSSPSSSTTTIEMKTPMTTKMNSESESVRSSVMLPQSSPISAMTSSASPPRYLETFPTTNNRYQNQNNRYMNQSNNSINHNTNNNINHDNHNQDYDEDQSLLSTDNNKNKSTNERPKIIVSKSSPMLNRQNDQSYSTPKWNFEKNNNQLQQERLNKDSVELVWRNLSYTVSRFQWKTFLKQKGRGFTHKHLLNSISGSMRAGELMAIMGPSGAGKTTMIECISGRRRIGVSGDIFVANCTKRTKLAYMAQEDAFMPCLTVFETLLFASKLRNYQRNNRCKVKLVDDNENVYNATTYPDSDLVIRSVNDINNNDEIACGSELHENTNKVLFSDNYNNNNNDQNNYSRCCCFGGASDSGNFACLPDGTYHRNLVNQIISKLGLDQCRNVKAENCSGGQQKRLCIALELIHSPTILILDEPTSGLDSVSCLQCVSLLRELAHNSEQPMAIAASIHQPTARILQNFDRLYVLAYNGQCLYDGPVDQLVPYLSRYKLSCPTYHNPADFVLEVATGDYGHDVIKQMVKDQALQHQKGCLMVKFPEKISSTQLTADSSLNIKESTVVNVDDDNSDDATIMNDDNSEVRLWPENVNTVSISKICQRSRKQVKRREFYKTILLWIRCMLLSYRDPTEYLLRLFATISIILLNIVLYNDSKMGQADGCSQDTVMHMINTIRSDYDGNQSFSLANSLLEGPGAMAILNFGYIFFAMTFCAFLSMMPTILTFPLEVAVFYKEYFNGWYSFSSYFLAKNLTNLLPAIILPILYGSTTFFITNQYWETWRFCYFIALLVMISLVADGIGLTISAIFVHNVNAASIFAATSQIPLLLFTGFLVQIDQLPRIIQPLTYLSFYRLFFESTVITFYGFERCPQPEPFNLKRIRGLMGDDAEEMMNCVWENTNFFDSSEGPSLTDRLERILSASENQNPSLILQNFRLNEKDLPFLMIMLGSYAIITRIIAYIVLYRKANSRR